MPGMTAAQFELDAAGGQIELIVRDQHLVGRDLVKSGQRGHGGTGQVHVGLRLQQPGIAPGRGKTRDLCLKL